VVAMPRLIVVTEEMDSPYGTQMLAALLIDEAIRRGLRSRCSRRDTIEGGRLGDGS
jgi:hypothetical protein